MTTLIRLENLAFAIATLIMFQTVGGNWGLFALLVLTPDLSMLGYLAGSRIGAISYNIFHSWIGPVLLCATAIWVGHWLTLSIGLVWGFHIGIDRALGYGLKHYTGFKDTHLGQLGTRGN
jgi:hypothetical protein